MIAKDESQYVLISHKLEVKHVPNYQSPMSFANVSKFFFPVETESEMFLALRNCYFIGSIGNSFQITVCYLHESHYVHESLLLWVLAPKVSCPLKHVKIFLCNYISFVLQT